MSAEINNREYRQEVLKELIGQLHSGKTVEEVQDRFAQVFGNVSAEEIAQAEQALIMGGLPVTEVQRLCDVHAAVFKGSIEDIHRATDPSHTPGHPLNTLWRENRALEELVARLEAALAAPGLGLAEELEQLAQIDSHYLKKENLLFPYLEQYGVTAPPKVMWGVDDEIRAERKAIVQALSTQAPDAALCSRIGELLHRVTEMIFKEENILFPMLIEHLTQDEWNTIALGCAELGFCLIDGAPDWKPGQEYQTPVQEAVAAAPGVITLPTGSLKTEELVRLLNLLPIDITFVDKDDTVKYFSQGAERIFPRTKSIIGRNVSNCHPPASVHIVEKLVEDFKSGAKDGEDFWIQMGPNYILIRYFAVRSERGEYLGVLEVTQNIAPLREITGEKRLVEN